jgi:hypothetical protein
MRSNDPFFKIVDSVQLVKEDFLRFILLAIICFFFGGTETAIMLGPLYALLVLALITIFTLISLVIWVKTKQKSHLIAYTFYAIRILIGPKRFNPKTIPDLKGYIYCDIISINSRVDKNG